MSKRQVRKTSIVASPQAQRLRALRLARRLSQDRVATDLGVHQVTYCFWETGRYPLTLARLRQLALYFDVPLGEIAEDYELSADELDTILAARELKQPA